MSLGVNVDFRYEAGYPTLRDAKRYGIDQVRVISLPEMEPLAAEYLDAGIKVGAIYTGESDRAGRYVMQNCSWLQIGNEWNMGGDASWPTGNANDFFNVWSHVSKVLVPAVHPNGLPLVGPGMWIQDWVKWGQIGKNLPSLSAAACHVYPSPSGQTPDTVRTLLVRFNSVRPDVPLICTEWNVRGGLLAFAASIDAVCASRLWFTWGPGVPGMDLYGTSELGPLSLL